tara:strand:- start:166 stop:366 length:201 start_codon:yes stop_codon:yes gene_type:complete
MAKQKAIEICKNLFSTIKTIKDKQTVKIYKLEDWKPPQANAKDLQRKLDKLVAKYLLEPKDYDRVL